MSNAQLPSTSETTRPSFPTGTGTMDTILTETEIRGTTEITFQTATMMASGPDPEGPPNPSPPPRFRTEREVRDGRS